MSTLLEDEKAIRELLHAYCFCMDRGNADELVELFTEDCVWDQRPIPRLIGPQQAVLFLKLARATLGLVTIDVEILHIASAGQIVHVQRVDRLRRADGSLIVAAPVAGVLEFHGERVIAWREYFDLAEFVIQALATSCLYVARRSAQIARTTAMAAVRRR